MDLKGKAKISILGGGPAGLATSYFAKKVGLETVLFEAKSQIGGNCKTLSYGEFKFDTGAHRLHNKSDEVVKEIKGLLKEDLMQVDKPSYIFHKGKYLLFPISPFEVVFKLSPLTGMKAFLSFLLRKRGNGQLSFRDMAEAKYGKTISDLFLNNYSEKLWGLPTNKLSPRISGNRLKYLNFQTMIKDFILRNSDPKHMEGKFYYPVEGFGQIAEALGDYVGRENIKVNKRISSLHHNGKRIEQVEFVDGSRVEVDQVISSLPLTLSIKMLKPEPDKEILQLAQKVAFRHLILVCFFLNKQSVSNAATIYFPTEEFDFTRGYEPRNRSTKLSPKGKTSFIVEVPTDNLETCDYEALSEKIKSQLISYGFFRESEVIDITLKDIPFAYPVLRVGIEEDIQELISFLSRFENFHLTGRNGLFEYSWTHDMFLAGKKIIDQLCKKV